MPNPPAMGLQTDQWDCPRCPVGPHHELPHRGVQLTNLKGPHGALKPRVLSGRPVSPGRHSAEWESCSGTNWLLPCDHRVWRRV